MWKETDLKQASYRGIEFDFIDIGDELKKTIARYDYPYRDGSTLEDMGLEARSVRIKAVFMNERYAALESFIDALKEQGEGEVSHPVFGTFKALAETISIRHDERAYYAEIDITFIEHKAISVIVPVQSAESRSETITENKNEAASLLEKNISSSYEDAGIPVDDISVTGLGETGYISSIVGYAKKVRDVMKKIDSFVGKIKSYINKTSEPFKLITSTVNYLTNLSGSILNSIAGSIESVAGAYRSLLNAPGKFMSSLSFGLKKIEKALGNFEGDKRLKAVWDVSKAIALATAAGLELKIDERTESQRFKGSESQRVKDSKGQRVRESEGQRVNLSEYGGGEAVRTQLMTIDEIDEVAAIARESLATAIASVREVFGIETKEANELEIVLKKQALTIQLIADEIRLRRERIVDYEVPSDMPLHLLSFNLYGDINMAERLLLINKIRNPNFLKAGDMMRIYA